MPSSSIFRTKREHHAADTGVIPTRRYFDLPQNPVSSWPRRRPGRYGRSERSNLLLDGISRSASLLAGEFTRVEMGHIVMGRDTALASRVGRARCWSPSGGSFPGAGSPASCRGSRSPTRWLSVVVMIARVRTHFSVPGRCQFSRRPARPNGAPSFVATA
jgi:hypothetical protein